MPKTLAALCREILGETENLARACAEEFRDNPRGELVAWLRIAVQREAMVRELYNEPRQKYRLPGSANSAVAEMVWDTLATVWVHEATHTAYLKAQQTRGLFKDRAIAQRVKPLIGAMEGGFLDILTGGKDLAQFVGVIAVRLASWLNPKAVPPFTKKLTTLEPRGFFTLCETLETTAVASYTHMEALAHVLQNQIAKEGRSSVQLNDFVSELGDIRLEEIWHESAFREIASWVSSDGTFDDRCKAPEFLERIMRQAPARLRVKTGDVPQRAAGRAPVVVRKDAGFGPLFKKYGLNFQVMQPPARPLVQQSVSRSRSSRTKTAKARARPPGSRRNRRR